MVGESSNVASSLKELADAWGAPENQYWIRGEDPEQAVDFTPERNAWNIYGYPEAAAVLSDPATFSSNVSRILPDEVLQDLDRSEVDRLREGNLAGTDPPEHRKLRVLVSKAFTPKMIANLEARISSITHDLLDAKAGANEVELVNDLAYPLPAIVIAELLGVPSTDYELFRGWIDAYMGVSLLSFTERSEEQERAMKSAMDAMNGIGDYIRGQVEERRRKPGDDLLSKLIEAEADGARLSANGVVNFGNLLLVGGHLSTTMLLGNTAILLDLYPEWRRRAAEDQKVLAAVIEESLRYLTPFAVSARVTNREVEVAGSRIPADQLVMVWLATANRDPRQFSHPHVFDPSRSTNPHISFGHGVHYCIGSALTRLEAKISLTVLLNRYPNMRINHDDPPEFAGSTNMTGLRKANVLLS